MGFFNNLSSIFSKKKPSNEAFYSLFKENSAICKASANLFLKILQEGVDDNLMVDARQYKHKSNKILKKTLKVLNQPRVKFADRDDIQTIASLLNRITKKIIKACMNFKVYRIGRATEHMLQQANILISATNELDYIMQHFTQGASLNEITDRNMKMKEIETRGDEIHYLALDLLFSGQYDALNVIKLRDIHKDIESALDTCYDVSDTIVNVLYKEN